MNDGLIGGDWRRDPTDQPPGPIAPVGSLAGHHDPNWRRMPEPAPPPVVQPEPPPPPPRKATARIWLRFKKAEAAHDRAVAIATRRRAAAIEEATDRLVRLYRVKASESDINIAKRSLEAAKCMSVACPEEELQLAEAHAEWVAAFQESVMSIRE